MASITRRSPPPATAEKIFLPIRAVAASAGRILVMANETTVQASNRYGGRSTYGNDKGEFNLAARVHRVSFDRPPFMA